MKATMSKDGEMRFSLRVEIRASRLDLVNAVLWDWERNQTETAAYKRRGVFDLVKRAAASEGDHVWAYVEHVKAESFVSASRIVDALFPELVKTPAKHP